MAKEVKNGNLNKAKKERNGEYYTLYEDVESEMNAYIAYDKDVFKGKVILCPCDDPEWSNFIKYFVANFERLGLKKLISTSYAHSAANKQISLFELESEEFDKEKHDTHGRIFVLERGKYNGRINEDHLEWHYLDGDGDFRSDEVTKLRDEADMIVTNPPFFHFRRFLKWIMDANKQFAIIGNQNAITYKEVFPLIKNNEIWIGCKSFSGGMNMIFPPSIFDDKKVSKYRINEDGQIIINVMGVIWFTNIEHGKRHEPLQLMTMRENLKFNKKLKKELMKSYGRLEYPKYDNYDALEVPLSNAIPSDYDGVLGVPITFLDKYCPEQFEIIGLDRYTVPKEFLVGGRVAISGKPTYARILIRPTKISAGKG